jgi:hypothetical protein
MDEFRHKYGVILSEAKDLPAKPLREAQNKCFSVQCVSKLPSASQGGASRSLSMTGVLVRWFWFINHLTATTSRR